MTDPLFFLAILPDNEIQQEVTSFKQECADLFQARHAFKSPPHITLIAPFRWPVEALQDLRETLAEFAYDQLSFTVRLNGFNCFAPRVIFVDMEKNGSLEELQRELAKSLARTLDFNDKRNQRFHPHMTIAHRDLEVRVFPRAWAHFSKRAYQRQFLVENIVLLRHEKGQWQVLERFVFA
ncbi:MAG: 2'-5' RNA ligase family protein [Bacteroidota bacterium]